MRTSAQPPMHARKGIKVMQTQPPIHPTAKLSDLKQRDNLLSEVGSIRSSRSRGISMSRESGINLDRIYEAKHFLPPKANHKKATQKSREGQTRTIISCKSLEFIHMQESESTNQLNNFEEMPMQAQKIRKESIGKGQPQSELSPITLENPVDVVKNKSNKAASQSHVHPNIISF